MRLGWPRRQPAEVEPDDNLFDLDLLRTASRRSNRAEIRRLCRTVRLADDTALCRVLGRYKMYVDVTDEGLSPHLMLDGLWEMWVTEAMPGFVRGGMTVVDVGANLGYFTMLLADLVGAEGRVLAAEPNPRMMSLLARSVRVNGFGPRVSLHAAPLSARAGDAVSLHVPAGLPQNGQVVADPLEPAPGALRLTTTTLDELVGDGPCDFVKIDAEGAEQDIWTGMARVLARRAPLAVFVEFTPARYTDPAGFLRRMLETGFALAIVDHQAGVRPVGPAEVLAGRGDEDRMLVLAR